MIRRPPRSTLFPTRRSSDLSFASDAAGASQTTRSAGAPTVMVPVPRARRKIRALFPVASARSEEHTSELQSRSDLVCRLLLEKNTIIHLRSRSNNADDFYM